MEGAAVFPLKDLPFRLPGLFPRQAGGDSYKGIQRRLETVDRSKKSRSIPKDLLPDQRSTCYVASTVQDRVAQTALVSYGSNHGQNGNRCRALWLPRCGGWGRPHILREVR
jgi:hypothetical protein